MRNIRLYIYIAFMAVLLSCDKESLQQEGAGDFVSFYVSDKNFADEVVAKIKEIAINKDGLSIGEEDDDDSSIDE